MSRTKLTWLVVFLSILTLAVAPGTLGRGKAAAQQQTKLVFWIHAAEPFIAAHQAIIKLYEAKNPNVTIELQSFPFADFGTKVATSIPANAGPDIVEAYSPWMTLFIHAGKLSPVPDSFATSQGMADRYYSSALTLLQDKGKYYGVPSNVAAGSTRVLLVNDSVVSAAGVDLSKNKTFDDWIKSWQALTKADNSGRITRAGLGMYCGQAADLFVSYLMEYGGSVTDETGHKATFNSPEGKQALQLLVDYVKKYKVDSIDLTDFSCVAQGTAATSYRGTWVIPVFQAEFKDFKYHYELLPLPTGATKEVWQGGTGWATYVLGSSKNTQAAWDFVTFLEANRKVWIQQTGEIPAQKALAKEMTAENPQLYGVYYPILEQSRHGYPYGDYFFIQNLFQNMITSVLQDQGTVDSALTDAEQQFNTHLQTWWQQVQDK